MVPSNQVFSAFSFIGFVLVSIPLAWHLESWNTGTCLYMIWTSLSCLSQFINSVVWNNNAINWAPVWCDISSRLIIGASVAIPASSLCISRRLYHIAVMNIVKHVQYIVQGHRFNIYEEIGCYPAVYDTPAAYPIILIWPVAIGLVSSVYAGMLGLTIRTIIKRKARMDQLFQAHRNINPSIYRRLMALSTLEILCTVPLGLYSLIIDASGDNVAPYISWENVHYDFSYVGQIPVVLWQMDPQFVVRVELTRWLLVLCAFAFFAFFGLAKEARKNYSLAFYAVRLSLPPFSPFSPGSYTQFSSILLSNLTTSTSLGRIFSFASSIGILSNRPIDEMRSASC
ncbi:hypothetical protein SERLA73DRAFT_166760 [Serpula lacrymans var. lacrymans S7.3]|uniref:Uncharacterized protein n=1 Tax=Serpula lacrymans var. lacrymans (strain S7.3) TaxID=936435 RepID=F8PQV9_SERL3|nr:hypothetical protein SERLA73DRAFT_166760 [Serpula lacrymans var. lacrymans S7.3]